MVAKGIRISDDINRVVSVSLHDILEEIKKGNSLHWSILYLEGIGYLCEGKSISAFEDQIVKSERGIFIDWDDLVDLANRVKIIHHIIVIGCLDEQLLTRYQNDQDMYETCDIVIEMFDSCFWEVFSKDETLISRLASKFQKTEFLETDFEK